MDFLDQLINIIFCFFHIPIEERHAAIEASFQPEADTYIICILTIFRRSKFHNLIIERQSLIKFTSQDMSPSQRTENVEIIRILVIRFIEQSHGIINTMSLEKTISLFYKKTLRCLLTFQLFTQFQSFVEIVQTYITIYQRSLDQSCRIFIILERRKQFDSSHIIRMGHRAKSLH